MANYWPGLGYITPRRTITTIIRGPSIPSTSTTTGRPSMAPLGFLLSPLTIPTRSSSSSSTETKTCSANDKKKKLTTNATTTTGNNNKLSTNAATTTTSKKGGHFPISDSRDLPRKALATSLHHIGPKEAHLATQLLHRGQRPHHATTAGARPSRLGIWPPQPIRID